MINQLIKYNLVHREIGGSSIPHCTVCAILILIKAQIEVYVYGVVCSCLTRVCISYKLCIPSVLNSSADICLK